MATSRSWRTALTSDLGILVVLALVKLIVHALTGSQYGFHRDELGMLTDARYLDWGYVTYPPLTPLVASMSLALFGETLWGLRFFAALSQSIAMVLAGLTARELGGRRTAQVLTALAVAIAPISLVWSSMFHYGGLDYLWWTLLAFLVARLLHTENPRYWLGIGVVIGLGMLTKYTMAVCVAGLVAGILLTPARRYLRSPWLWGGVLLSVLVFLPNLIWQAQHGWIHLEFLASIHARDVRIGRTEDFLPSQFYQSTNPITVPLWIAGLYFYFSPRGKRYRMLGWMAVVAFIILVAAQGRGYYTGPLYVPLMAGGAVLFEHWLAALTARQRRWVSVTAWTLVAILGVAVAAMMLPLAPINSAWWQAARAVYVEPREQIGWPEMVQEVGRIYGELPPEQQAHALIVTNASDLEAMYIYGAAYSLPPVVSSQNTNWLRFNPAAMEPPQVFIVVAWQDQDVRYVFSGCQVAGQITNGYNVKNENSSERPNIYVCTGTRRPWGAFWQEIRAFG
jgi:4-amino-4-deoxy-L-arabinose transferase-like glycosyltransferase